VQDYHHWTNKVRLEPISPILITLSPFISESQSRVLNIIETARGKGDIQKAVDEIFNQNERHHYGVLFSWNFSIIIIKKCI
jgi:hypothetical protein